MIANCHKRVLSYCRCLPSPSLHCLCATIQTLFCGPCIILTLYNLSIPSWKWSYVLQELYKVKNYSLGLSQTVRGYQFTIHIYIEVISYGSSLKLWFCLDYYQFTLKSLCCSCGCGDCCFTFVTPQGRQLSSHNILICLDCYQFAWWTKILITF